MEMETDCYHIYWAYFFVFICGFSNWKTWKEIFPINWQTETNKNSYEKTPDHHRTPIVTNNKKTHSKRKNVVHSLKIKFSLNRDGRTDARKYIHIRLLAVWPDPVRPDRMQFIRVYKTNVYFCTPRATRSWSVLD